jgi:hypothetical protein
MKTRAMVFFTCPFSKEILLGYMTSVNGRTALINSNNVDYVVNVKYVTICKTVRACTEQLILN